VLRAHPLIIRLPPVVKGEATMRPPPTTVSHRAMVCRRGKARRAAPTCRGTTAVATPIQAGRAKRKTRNEPW
jgi:hypothetical protein